MEVLPGLARAMCYNDLNNRFPVFKNVLLSHVEHLLRLRYFSALCQGPAQVSEVKTGTLSLSRARHDTDGPGPHSHLIKAVGAKISA